MDARFFTCPQDDGKTRRRTLFRALLLLQEATGRAITRCSVCEKFEFSDEINPNWKGCVVCARAICDTCVTLNTGTLPTRCYECGRQEKAAATAMALKALAAKYSPIKPTAMNIPVQFKRHAGLSITTENCSSNAKAAKTSAK